MWTPAVVSKHRSKNWPHFVGPLFSYRNPTSNLTFWRQKPDIGAQMGGPSSGFSQSSKYSELLFTTGAGKTAGLKLATGKRLTGAIVIDHIEEKPADN